MLEFKPFSITTRGRLLSYDRPIVAGIVNVTPDSFYPGSRRHGREEVADCVRHMIDEGADWIDIGAYSSRPGASDISPQEETDRLAAGMEVIRAIAPDVPVSVDTFRAAVAHAAVTEMGADIINDISGGDLDPDMAATVARLGTPYILMHTRGTPATMGGMTQYSDVTADVLAELSEKIDKFALLGVNDIIVDPGFGFAKTVEQNYRLLHDLRLFHVLGRPLLIGVSRKSMIYRPLGITPDEALNGTTVINTIALSAGAAILRVHDVKPAVEAIKITTLTNRK